MEIDSYQQCPCQSGKKIKFCCGKDLVHDLNTVLSKEQAGQSVAALEHLERAIAKVGPRECLLTIQTHILIAHGEIDKAQKANKLLLDNHPGHVTGLQHSALIELAEGNSEGAVAKLQDAMDSITGNELPISLANAFRALGLGLINEGQLLAGRAHLEFASELKGGQDEELDRMIFETYFFNGLPTAMKRTFEIAEPPADEVEWHKKYVNVKRALARGQFRKALKFLNKIDTSFPDQPQVVEAIAIVSGFLGQQDTLPEKFRRVTQLPDCTPWDAVEAETVAQVIDSKPMVPEQTVLRLSHELNDISQVTELLTSHNQFVALPDDQQDPFGEGPAPKHSYAVLNKPMVRDTEELNIDTVPNVLAEIKLYGKQTDREARLEVIVSSDHCKTETVEILRSVLGESLQQDPAESQLGQASVIDRVFRVDWHLPQGTSRKQFDSLMEQYFPTLLEQYSQLKFRCLDNKTIIEAAREEKYEVAVQSLLVRLSATLSDRQGGREAAQKYIDQLGVDLPDSIDPTTLENVGRLSPFQMQFVDMSKLSDEQLFEIHRTAVLLRLPAELLLTVNEMLSRDDFDLMPRDLMLSMKARATHDNDEAFICLEEAREEARKSDRPIGHILLQEFEMRLERGLTEKLPSLLQTLRNHHLDEPNVEAGLAELLHRYGLIDEEQILRGRAQTSVHTATTTEAEEPAPAVATSEEPSKLWLPD